MILNLNGVKDLSRDEITEIYGNDIYTKGLKIEYVGDVVSIFVEIEGQNEDNNSLTFNVNIYDNTVLDFAVRVETIKMRFISNKEVDIEVSKI